jgi:hypothetical protein
VWPKEILHFFAWNLKHHPGSELGALEVEFGPLPMKNLTRKAQQITKKEHNTTQSAWKLNGAHHGVRPHVEIQILQFLL